MRFKKLTTKEFIDKANQIHNYHYNYDKTEYIRSNQKLTIDCYIHGQFQQIASNHLNGMGCSKCGLHKMKEAKKTKLNKFLSKANIIHNNYYDYSLITSNTVCSLDKILIICPIHDQFEQIAGNHLNAKSGCPKCGSIKNNRSIKQKSIICKEQFVKKAKAIHGLKYDYSLVDYVKTNILIKIICKNMEYLSNFRINIYYITGVHIVATIFQNQKQHG